MFFVTFCTKGLSEYDRQRLCLTLVGLNTLQILLSIAGFYLGAYISISVNSKAHLVKGYSLKPVGGTISGCSIALFIYHCFGAKVSNDCGYQRTRLRWKNKLFLVVIGCIVMSAAIIAVSVFCVMQNFKLKEAMSYGLMHTMHSYSKEKHTKQELDEIQMDYKCCGSSNYTDWFKIKWISEPDLPPKNNKEFNRRDYLHSVPFSCCDPSVAAPCFHQMVTVRRGKYSYPHHGFFKRGCTQVLLEVLQEILLDTALLFLLPFFIELTIAIQTRYLQTSLDDCKRWENPKNIGSCWLFRKYSYDPYLQFREAVEDDIPHSFSSSSEELVVYEPNTKILSVTEKQHNSEKAQRKSKKRTQTINDENDSDDLRTLLLKNVNGNSGSVTSKIVSQHKYSSTKKEKEQIHHKRKTKEQTNNPQVLNENRSNEK